MSSPSEDIREQCYHNKIGSAPVTLHKRKNSEIFLSKDDIKAVDNGKKYHSGNFCRKIVQGIVGSKKQQISKQKSELTVKQLSAEISQYFKKTILNISAIENASISKLLALLYLADNKELEACCCLISSHASYFRQQILFRNEKAKVNDEECEDENFVHNLDPKDLDIDLNNNNTNPDKLVSTLAELPTEWYVLQVTSQHEHTVDMRHRLSKGVKSGYCLKPMNGLHLVVLPTGKNAKNPVCITLPKPNVNSTYDIRTEIETLLNNNASDLTAKYNNNKLYQKMRKQQNDRMSTAISELEFSWLREWRVLLLADYVECLDLVQDIHDMIDKLIADSNVKKLSERTRWLLRKIATGACYLQPFEIERAVTYVLSNEPKLAKNIILSIVAKTKVMEPLKNARRKVLVLIVDECIDHLSYESLSILKHQPVTRFPSLHIAYALYNKHKSTMKDGYKVIKKSEDLGSFIVNPSSNLSSTELRIRSFMEYWLPIWKGIYGTEPDKKYFAEILQQYQLFIYSGHGCGIRDLGSQDLEKLRILSAVLLFGCSTIKLFPSGGRNPHWAPSDRYFTACSPCMLGMLWEVTDADIDRMTARFLSNWIPSSAKRSWSDVNPSSWDQGKIEFQKGVRNEKKFEDNMLVAVAKSKDSCNQFMTAAAIVARGLPMKLID